jgi:cell surface protein SprA
MQEYYYADRFGNFHASNKINSGNFNMTFLSWRTAFENPAGEIHIILRLMRISVIQKVVIAGRLAEKGGIPRVMIRELVMKKVFPTATAAWPRKCLMPAFMAAYGRMDPENITLSNFPVIPLPNWRIVYDGLSSVPLLNRVLQTANINHAYRSTYSISNYITNLSYFASDDGLSYIRDNVRGNFIPEYDIHLLQ